SLAGEARSEAQDQGEARTRCGQGSRRGTGVAGRCRGGRHGSGRGCARGCRRRIRIHGGREVSTTISAKDVKALRDQTGAGMMDGKRALVETNADADAALELLKVQLGNKIAKLGGRAATEGTVQSS